MENNEQEKTNNTVNDSKFRTVSNPGTYRTVYEMDNKPKKNSNFGRNIVVPFISGVVGCAVVLGTCFGVTSIREQILGTDGSSSSSSSSSESKNIGTVDQVSLSNYSDTAVYAANKILPSIVGIKIEYMLFLQVNLNHITKYLKLQKLLLHCLMMKQSMKQK